LLLFSTTFRTASKGDGSNINTGTGRAPTVFALFMASLVAVLVLSYAGVQIV
jgi:hypothetical protein